MLTTLLCAVFGLTCLLHSSQAFYCKPVTLKNALCDGDKRFLIQGTVKEAGDVIEDMGPRFSYAFYTVWVEYVYRDDENIIYPGSNVTVVTDDQMFGGKFLYIGNTYVFAGTSDLVDGQEVLLTGDCQYHDKIYHPTDLTDSLPSCDDEVVTTETWTWSWKK